MHRLRMALIGTFLAALGPLSAADLDPALLAGMKARSIGPAGMSGRVTDVIAVESDPNIVYVAAATGGVWKSTNGALTFEPVFDDQRVASIGSLAVFEPSPDLVWVGTGEGNPRNSTSVGVGVYRSLDGGKSWDHAGLEQTERIHRIVTHPSDPDVVYAAALGRAWGENEQRGVFRTTDGGKTWQKILYVDQRTGCADLVMDPSNPRRLIAAMWDYRRWPWFFRSGGPGSGLYLTVDGGETWKRLTPEDGLPEGDLGRIGLAFSRWHPEIVYAIVEAEKNVLLRSEDGGSTWKDTEAERRFGNRPFYFSDLRVDPELPDRVYSLWSLVSVSEDAGRGWRVLVPFKDVHPDHHAMWINPHDPKHIIIGNDGGVAVSRDRGESWRFVSNLPLAQYYHIRVDMDRPYHVYGGMQDNGSWRGPSAVWENGGIRNHHWEEVGFGDGFDTVPDPENSRRGYAMSQEGYLHRWDLDSGQLRTIRPAAGAPEGAGSGEKPELRFNWNAGFAIDPFDPATIYYGSQFVHRSRDRGASWEVISDDLTTNEREWQRQHESGGLTPDVTGEENYTSILAIAPSPIERGVLWVGTDDGRVHVSRDGGETWSSVEGNVSEVPRHTWVPHIEPSHHAEGSAYVVFDDHRRSNWETYLFRASDYGRRFQRVPTENVDGYALVVAEDPVDHELLYLGTEFGLYVTVDGGKKWWKWTHGFPTVPTRDLVVHPREHDLVVGTHGRGAYVLDDVRPLRELSEELLAQPLHLFSIADAQQHAVKQTGASRFPGHGEFRGENREYGALLTYWLDIEELPHPDENVERLRQEEERRADSKTTASEQDSEQDEEDADDERKKEPEVTIRVLDASGTEIRTFKRPARLGINRASWDLRRDAFRRPRDPDAIWEPDRAGPEVPPGTYRVVVEYGDHRGEADLRVLADPRLDVSETARRAHWEAVTRAGAAQEKIADAVERIQRTLDDVRVVLDKAAARWRIEEHKRRSQSLPEDYRQLAREARTLREALEALEREFWRPPSTKGIIADTDALTKARRALRFLTSSWSEPTEAQQRYLAEAESVLEQALTRLDELFDEDVRPFRDLVETQGIVLLSLEPDIPR
ncbi:MAG: hypothetical protein JSV80_00340 [Acidobacteriota bacterium]|nr:MAG: hypothetical protein JSV80_00340 [Acidobacteriota bacterium]